MRTLFTALAEVWVRGMKLDWAAVFAESDAKRIALPTYAFQRQRYWLQSRISGAGDASLVANPRPTIPC